MMIGLVALALQAAAPAAHVDRSGAKWGVEYAPDQCIINRQFGEGPKPAILAIDVDPVSDRGDLVLLMPEKAWRGTDGTAAITMGPSGATSKAPWVGADIGQGMYAFKLSLDDEQWAQAKTSDVLSIDAGAAMPIAVPVKGIGKAFAATKTCGRNLLHAWGADPDAMIDVDPKIAVRWVGPNDYPIEALRSGQQGLVKALVTVNAAGKPTGCRVVVSSKSPSLDETSCRVVMTRGAFPPADTPVRYYFRRTRWLIPRY